jgi:hypothetical protein
MDMETNQYVATTEAMYVCSTVNIGAAAIVEFLSLDKHKQSQYAMGFPARVPWCSSAQRIQ